MQRVARVRQWQLILLDICQQTDRQTHRQTDRQMKNVILRNPRWKFRRRIRKNFLIKWRKVNRESTYWRLLTSEKSSINSYVIKRLSICLCVCLCASDISHCIFLYFSKGEGLDIRHYWLEFSHFIYSTARELGFSNNLPQANEMFCRFRLFRLALTVLDSMKLIDSSIYCKVQIMEKQWIDFGKSSKNWTMYVQHMCAKNKKFSVKSFKNWKSIYNTDTLEYANSDFLVLISEDLFVL